VILSSRATQDVDRRVDVLGVRRLAAQHGGVEGGAGESEVVEADVLPPTITLGDLEQAIQRRRDVLPSPSTALAATMDYAGLRIAVGTLIAERPRVGTRLPRPLMAFSRQREQRGATFAGSRLVACD